MTGRALTAYPERHALVKRARPIADSVRRSTSSAAFARATDSWGKASERGAEPPPSSLAQQRFCALHPALRQGGMRVDRHREILGKSGGLYRESGLCDQLARAGADDSSAEHSP